MLFIVALILNFFLIYNFIWKIRAAVCLMYIVAVPFTDQQFHFVCVYVIFIYSYFIYPFIIYLYSVLLAMLSNTYNT